jgi:IMP dehydrogenase/GMP reductase
MVENIMTTLSYTFDDIILIPQMTTLRSRSEANTSVKIWKYERPNPIISANMKTVTDSGMANAMWDAGGIGAIHRFWDIEANVIEYRRVKYSYTIPGEEESRDCFVSIGINEPERAEALYNAGARMFIVDIAHGHSIQMEETIKWMRDKWGDDVYIMAGNVATGTATNDLIMWGADAIKCGVGPGCFASGTKVLMANGTYKNIEKINPGEFVINKNGKPVRVLNKINSGIRKVVKQKTSSWHKDTFVTPDHKYWIGDCRSVSWETFQSKGISKLLEQQSKTIPKSSKYKWEQIENTNNQTLTLMPKNIDYHLQFDFGIDLAQFSIRSKITTGTIKTNGNKEFKRWIKCSYNLGYVFGTFLGDGNARVLPNGSGVVCWYFGKNEDRIVDKLIGILRGYGLNPSIDESANLKTVIIYNKYFAMLLEDFGKREKKSLNEKYLACNKEYVLGIYDGLIDSDGHTEKNGRDCFTNTSEKLIELFYFCCSILGKSYNAHTPSKSAGFECNFDNLNEAHNVKIHTSNRFTENCWYGTFRDREEQEIEIETWDIEVDCPTHSFIANNCIVHNSVCTTRTVTGHGVPQFSAIQDCAYWTDAEEKLLVADGGIRYSGDIVKSIVAGANMVMIGGLLAPAKESAAPATNGQKFYKGSAADPARGQVASEGTHTRMSEGGTVEEIVGELVAGVRSGMSYSNARTFDELWRNARYKTQTMAGYHEGLPHGAIK